MGATVASKCTKPADKQEGLNVPEPIEITEQDLFMDWIQTRYKQLENYELTPKQFYKEVKERLPLGGAKCVERLELRGLTAPEVMQLICGCAILGNLLSNLRQAVEILRTEVAWKRSTEEFLQMAADKKISSVGEGLGRSYVSPDQGEFAHIVAQWPPLDMYK